MNAYDGDDDASMEANNTSAFNDRNVVGTQSLSMHAYGAAIDINPVQNPAYDRVNGMRAAGAESRRRLCATHAAPPRHGRKRDADFRGARIYRMGRALSRSRLPAFPRFRRPLAQKLVRLPAAEAWAMFNAVAARHGARVSANAYNSTTRPGRRSICCARSVAARSSSSPTKPSAISSKNTTARPTSRRSSRKAPASRRSRARRKAEPHCRARRAA